MALERATSGTPRPGRRPRFISLDSVVTAERFGDPLLVDGGMVSVMSLEAVVDRFGPKWALRREQVYDYVDRTLERHVGIEGFFVRVSETEYLVCQPTLERHAGLAVCLHSLRDILNHFVGDAALAARGVLSVTRIVDGAAQATAIDLRAVERAAPPSLEPERNRVGGANGSEAKEKTDQWAPFIAANGREVRVSCVLEPVYELKTYGRIGFRLARRVIATRTHEVLTSAQVANLSRADLLRIDLTTIARGVDRLKSVGEGEKHPSLIIPVSFTSLSTLAGRSQIIAAFNKAAPLVDKGLVCEICDIGGVPQGVLLSATSLIRPFALFVVGGLDSPQRQPSDTLKGAGLDALSVECPPGMSDQAFATWAGATIGAAKRIAKSVMVYRVATTRHAGLAGLMGASHASIASGGAIGPTQSLGEG